MRSSVSLAALLVLLCGCGSVSGFYLPGVAPRAFADGEKVDLKVNKVASAVTQLPYKYYDVPGVCKPANVIDKVENLGEVLAGDRIESSDYEILVGVDTSCNVLCDNALTAADVVKLRQFVADSYRVDWVLDNLPAATALLLEQGNTTQLLYDTGFWLGGRIESQDVIPVPGESQKQTPVDQQDLFLNNHHDITIRYHEDPYTYEGRRIVGFEVYPASYDRKGCDEATKNLLVLPKGGQSEKAITWTYSIKWVADPTPWANRWDRYFFNVDPQIHWVALMNSLAVVVMLTGAVGMILLRTLSADILRYNSADANEEAEETGWKLVHGDVFRAPQRPLVLSVLVGSGQQLLVCALITLIFALLGFLSPANRGGILTAMIVLFVVTGIFAGYGATRMYKMLGGTRWRRCAMFTAMSIPGALFGIFFFLNFFIWGKHSSGAVPFGTLIAICALWCGVSLPLVFLGSYFGWKKPSPDQPVRTNTIPRQVPEQVWYTSGMGGALIGGLLPFSAVFLELFFIMSAIWGQHIYYLFGFLFLVFVILVVTSAEVSIVMVYLQLCGEDYHWWWQSFLASGSSAVYMLLYSFVYFTTKLEIRNFVSTLLFFGYSTIMAIIFFVLTGTVGYMAGFWFVRKIYSNVKVD